MSEPGGTEDTGFTGDKPDAANLGQVNDRLDRIEQALARLIPGTHDQAQARVEQRLDRPSTVEDQVRAELERARTEQAKADADAAAKKEQDDLRATVAKLTESKPAPPARRSTKLLGWGDGR